MSGAETLSEFVTAYNYYQDSSYCIVAVATVVIYDWLTSLDKEVDLIWNRKLTFVSWLYFICRYLSIIVIIFGVLMTTTLPLPTMGCTAISQTYSWSNFVIVVASHAIMVLRIHAMFHKSKAILVLLLAAFIAMDAFNVVGYIPSSEHQGSDINPLSMMYLCAEPNTWNYETFSGVTCIPAIAFGLLLMGLSLFGFYQHGAENKKNIGIWSANAWMRLLMAQNVIYFVVVVGCDVITIAASYSNNQYNLVAFGPTLVSLQNYILAPRLLLSFRGYHSRPAHSRSSSDGSFGVSTYASMEKDYQLPRPPSLGRESRASSRTGLGTWDAMTG